MVNCVRLTKGLVQFLKEVQSSSVWIELLNHGFHAIDFISLKLGFNLALKG